MNDSLTYTAPLIRWQGDRGTYHLVTFGDEAAEAIAMHARLLRLEYGTRRGFGSVKVIARIGETQWRSSVFPQRQQTEWVLLVSRKVISAEGLAVGDSLSVQLELV